MEFMELNVHLVQCIIVFTELTTPSSMYIGVHGTYCTPSSLYIMEFMELNVHLAQCIIEFMELTVHLALFMQYIWSSWN